jgi:hypothetical protein
VEFGKNQLNAGNPVNIPAGMQENTGFLGGPKDFIGHGIMAGNIAC